MPLHATQEDQPFITISPAIADFLPNRIDLEAAIRNSGLGKVTIDQSFEDPEGGYILAGVTNDGSTALLMRIKYGRGALWGVDANFAHNALWLDPGNRSHWHEKNGLLLSSAHSRILKIRNLAMVRFHDSFYLKLEIDYINAHDPSDYGQWKFIFRLDVILCPRPPKSSGADWEG